VGKRAVVNGKILGKKVEIRLQRMPQGLVSWESFFANGRPIASGVTDDYKDLFDPDLISEVKEMTGYSMMFD
jgi:hypothetical protein